MTRCKTFYFLSFSIISQNFIMSLCVLPLHSEEKKNKCHFNIKSLNLDKHKISAMISGSGHLAAGCQWGPQASSAACILHWVSPQPLHGTVILLSWWPKEFNNAATDSGGKLPGFHHSLSPSQSLCFLILRNGNNNGMYFIVIKKVNQLIYMKYIKQCLTFSILT